MKLLFSYFIHSLTDNLASKSTLRSEKSCPWARPAWQVKKEDRFHSVSSQVDSWDVFSSEFFRSQGFQELFDRFGLWSVNQLSLYYPWNSIAKIGLLKASHSAHCELAHFISCITFTFAPKTYCSGVMPLYSTRTWKIEKEKGEEKMANKGWIVTIFVYIPGCKGEIWLWIGLDSGLFTHVHFLSGILHFVSMDDNSCNSALELIPCRLDARTCATAAIQQLSWLRKMASRSELLTITRLLSTRVSTLTRFSLRYLNSNDPLDSPHWN